mgnify:CR=1 FL=1
MQDASIKVQHSDVLHPRPCQKGFVITSMHGWMYAPHTFHAPCCGTLGDVGTQNSSEQCAGSAWLSMGSKKREERRLDYSRD